MSIGMCIQELLRSLFWNENAVLNGEQDTIHFLFEGGIEKTAPPQPASWCQMVFLGEGLFLSYSIDLDNSLSR